MEGGEVPTREMEWRGERLRLVDLVRLGAGRLPVTHRLLLENVLRGGDGRVPAVVRQWIERGWSESEIEFRPVRILMHDTTCGPALVDLAAARSALAEAGGNPASINPMLPVDVSTDHSLAADRFGTPDARAANMAREMERNAERYRFMRWASEALDRFKVHPPGTGIMHTINLERLASVVTIAEMDGVRFAVPDTLIGTDSHTPMINGIGVLGWGVGGLEAESVMLGMPVMMRIPEVVGVRLTGAMPEGVGATDLALAVTHRLRRMPLAGRFVEFFGPGVSTLSAGDRATVANMAPEYGSTTGFFPIDERTLDYLRQTGRSDEQIDLVRAHADAAGLWFDPDAEPAFTEVVEIDLNRIETSLAGPRRPQDMVRPADVPGLLEGPALPPAEGMPANPVAIAAITSCTNTSDPRQLVAAGLLARKARAIGMAPPHWVKTVLAPGSPTADALLERAGLKPDLEALGFAIAGFGCTVCIGNSGPLTVSVEVALMAGRANPVAFLSGNRNFPGRVHREVSDAFLASPPLVVAYALLGDAARPLSDLPLESLWPTGAEIDEALALALDPADFDRAYEQAGANPAWAALPASNSSLHAWDPDSTYLRRPPFVSAEASSRLGSYRAAPLLLLGDDVTTDHISPAGAIPAASEAGRWLIERGEDPNDLNVYASRRGNWEVMLRGIFTSPAVRNLLGETIPPGSTIHGPTGDILPLWQAARRFESAGESTVILAGERYGMGSSRDWAAKGAALLGARAVLALGFERIHRSNLVNMGVLPLRLPADYDAARLRLGPNDRIEIGADGIGPRSTVPVTILRSDGSRESLEALAEVETELEAEVLRAGGLLPMILAQRTPVTESSQA